MLKRFLLFNMLVRTTRTDVTPCMYETIEMSYGRGPFFLRLYLRPKASKYTAAFRNPACCASNDRNTYTKSLRRAANWLCVGNAASPGMLPVVRIALSTCSAAPDWYNSPYSVWDNGLSFSRWRVSPAGVLEEQFPYHGKE